MELENFMKTQMTSDINVTHKPIRFPGREVPSWMHEELSKKDATTPPLSPESERELNNILDHIDGVETHGLPDENGLYFEGKLKSLLAKAEQRARDEGIEDYENKINRYFETKRFDSTDEEQAAAMQFVFTIVRKELKELTPPTTNNGDIEKEVTKVGAIRPTTNERKK
jgi:hypothetical protein